MPSAALQHLGTAVEAGSFQGAGAMVPSARLLTPNGGAVAGPAPSRREEKSETTANGNGGGPGGPDLAALRPTNRPRGKAQPGKPRKRAPIWNLQAAVFVSVVLNVGLLLQHYVNSTAPSHHHHHQEHLQACPTHLLDAGVSRNRRGRQEEPSVPKAAGAPSTGKPAVTPDSVINLDQ